MPCTPIVIDRLQFCALHAYRKRKPCETGHSAGAPFAGPPRGIPRGRPDRWSDGRAYIARCLLYRWRWSLNRQNVDSECSTIMSVNRSYRRLPYLAMLVVYCLWAMLLGFLYRCWPRGGLIAMLAGRFTGKSMLFGCKALWLLCVLMQLPQITLCICEAIGWCFHICDVCCSFLLSDAGRFANRCWPV